MRSWLRSSTIDPIWFSTFLIRLLCSSTCAGAASSGAPLRPATVLPAELPDAVRPTGALVDGGRELEAASAPAARLAAALLALDELAVEPADGGRDVVVVARVSRVVVRVDVGGRFDTPPLRVLALAGRRAVDGGVGRLAVDEPARGSPAALRLGPRLVDGARGRVAEAAEVGRKPGAAGAAGVAAEELGAGTALMGDEAGRGSMVGSRDVGAFGAGR